MYNLKICKNLKNDIQKIFESPISEPALLHDFNKQDTITVSTNIVAPVKVTESTITELRAAIQTAISKKAGPKPTLSKLYLVTLNINNKLTDKFQIHFTYSKVDVDNFNHDRTTGI